MCFRIYKGMKNKLIYIIGGTILASSMMFGGGALAAGRVEPAGPVIFGTVESTSGTQVTISGKRGKEGTPTLYTVDTSAARITAGYGQGATPLESGALEVGDKVAVLAV